MDLPAEGSLHLKSHSQVQPQGWGVAGVHLQAQLGDALAAAPPLLNLQQPPPQALPTVILAHGEAQAGPVAVPPLLGGVGTVAACGDFPRLRLGQKA